VATRDQGPGAQSLDILEHRHRLQLEAMAVARDAIPTRWRQTRVDRSDLSRFLFEPADIVLAVGQDGLVANVAKYLRSQIIVGVNPDPAQYDGVLVRHAAADVADLLAAVAADRARIEDRTMVCASLDDGQQLLALNEVFLGHRTHQSARYRIQAGSVQERQSSSGVIVATGTGATGWAFSIRRQRAACGAPPAPCERRLSFYVREPFPSVSTAADLWDGDVAGDTALTVVSEMNDGGVVFGDGIEDDRLEFPWGASARVRIADRALRLAI
jgi:hypothetical protein